MSGIDEETLTVSDVHLKRKQAGREAEARLRDIERTFVPVPDCPLVTPMTRFLKLDDDTLRALYAIRKGGEHVLPPMPKLRTILDEGTPDEKPLALRGYQAQQVQHMYAMPRFINGDSVGLGKTLAAIAAACAYDEALGEKRVKVIVFTTTTTSYQWATEVKRFSLLTPWVLKDAHRFKGDKKITYGHEARLAQLKNFMTNPRLDVMICRYSQWLGRRKATDAVVDPDGRPVYEGKEYLSQEARDFRDALDGFKTQSILVLDETHKIKTPTAQIRKMIVAIQRKFSRVWGLTATAIMNHLEEFYSITSALGISPLGSLDHFREHYCVWRMVQKGRFQEPVIEGYKHLDLFKVGMRPWYWGRSQAQVKEPLPKLTTIYHPIEMSKEQSKLLLEDIPSGAYTLPPILKKVAGEWEFVERDPSNLMTMLSVYQLVANTPALLDRDDPKVFFQSKLAPKEEALLDLLDGELLGEKVIVFAQPLDAKVLTPEGWVRMGDIKVGDAVIDPDGGVGYVEGVYPKGMRDIYRVTTKSRATTHCCADHLWLAQSLSDRKGKTPWKVYETRDLIRRGTRRFNKNGSTAYRFTLPVAQPPEFLSWDPPIPAYTLGVLLGDGDITRSVTFASVDPEIVDRVSAEAPVGIRIAKHGLGISWGLSASNPSAKDSRGFNVGGNNPYRNALRTLDLLGRGSADKFIPKPYLYCSPLDRLALLQGLMDTDGTHNISNNSCHYVSTSRQLAADVAELTRSLGGLASVDGPYVNQFKHHGVLKDGAPHWVTQVRLSTCPFYLPRKAALWSQVAVHNPLKDIEPAGEAACQCIRVSTKRHLYITDDYIVTHNTKYRSWIDRLEHLTLDRKFTDRRFLRITGNEKGKTRETNRVLFQTNPSYNLIMINSAAVEGVNLQQAAHLICLDLPWSWGSLMQLVGRMVRMASPHSACMLHILMALGSLDEYVIEVQRSKKGVFERILGNAGTAGILDAAAVDLADEIDLAAVGLESEADDDFRDMLKAHAKTLRMRDYTSGTVLAKQGAGMRDYKPEKPQATEEELDSRW